VERKKLGKLLFFLVFGLEKITTKRNIEENLVKKLLKTSENFSHKIVRKV